VIRNWLRNFMMGRYGVDQLYLATMIAALCLSILASATGWGAIHLVSYALLIYAILRFLSRNITKRRRENDVFLRYWWPVKRGISGYIKRLKSSREYKFFKCPACSSRLRVPKHKGRIQITCPKCGERFERKT